MLFELLLGNCSDSLHDPEEAPSVLSTNNVCYTAICLFANLKRNKKVDVER